MKFNILRLGSSDLIEFNNKKFTLIDNVASFIRQNDVKEFTANPFRNKKGWKHVKLLSESFMFSTYTNGDEHISLCNQTLQKVFKRIPYKIYYK